MGVTFSTLPPPDLKLAFTGLQGVLPEGQAAPNFNEGPEVRATHKLIQAQVLARLAEHVFDGANPDAVGAAIASLVLYPCAEQQAQTTQWIEPGRDEALRTLAEHFTPMGMDALLAGLDESPAGSPEDHAVLQDFPKEDGYCLAGHLYRQRANAHEYVEVTDQTSEDASAPTAAGAWAAAQDYWKAAAAYEQAGAPGLATEAWQRAVDAATQAAAAYLRSYQPLKAADAYELVVVANTQAGQTGRATDARRRAAAAALAAANGFMLAGALAPAADAYARAAQTYTLTYERLEAARVWLNAADAYRRTHQPAQAARAYQRVAELFTHDGQLAQAADALLKAADAACAAADTCPTEERYRQAADVCVRAARACYALDQRGPGADAWRQAAVAYQRARQPRKAVDAWQQGAGASLNWCSSALTNGALGPHNALVTVMLHILILFLLGGAPRRGRHSVTRSCERPYATSIV